MTLKNKHCRPALVNLKTKSWISCKSCHFSSRNFSFFLKRNSGQTRKFFEQKPGRWMTLFPNLLPKRFYDYYSSIKLQLLERKLFAYKLISDIILFPSRFYSEAIVQEGSIWCQRPGRTNCAILLFSRRRPHTANSLAKGWWEHASWKVINLAFCAVGEHGGV